MITEICEPAGGCGNTAAALRGAEGELVLIRVSADARHLEDVLEAIAELPFPINPEINHTNGGARCPSVEFPAYSQRVPEVEATLAARGLSGEICRMEVLLQPY